MVSLAEADTLAILYPEIREPYRQLFLTIADGARDEYRGEVLPYELKQGGSADTLRSWLAQQHVDAVIALGNRGLSMLRQLPPTLPAVAGAVLVDPDHQPWSAISLAPSPLRLFRQLRQLQPDIKTVHVIYAPGPGTWLIDRARAAAKTLQLNLAEHPADGVYALAQSYRDVTRDMQSGRDALWIAYDGRGIDSALLEPLLEEAWERRLLVFSSNVVDVKRGVLFALYPDNRAMGAQLVNLLKQTRRADTGTIEPVDALLGAINLRTADHLGLSFSAQVRQSFSMTLP